MYPDYNHLYSLHPMYYIGCNEGTVVVMSINGCNEGTVFVMGTQSLLFSIISCNIIYVHFPPFPLSPRWRSAQRVR